MTNRAGTDRQARPGHSLAAGAAGAPVVEFRGISKGFPGVQALSEVSLTLRAGEVHAVVGENGAGKSTLMNILAGVLAPDAGELRIDGVPVQLRSPLDARARGVAVVFQELSLCPNLTVGENVMLPALAVVPAFGRVDRAALGPPARALLSRLGMPEIDPATPLRSLSVGQMQLVEIARALAREVRVLVLDEPNSALSPRETERLFEVVRGLRANGVAVVYVSHHLEEVLSLADRITVLRDGRWITTLDEVGDVQVPQLVAAMVGRDLGAATPHGLGAPRPKGPAVLEVERLSVPGQIDGIDLALRPGEILGVAGLPDSGKDVLAEALFGVIPSAGTVRVAGAVVPRGAPARSIRAGLALIPADRRQSGALLAMSVAENTVSSTLPRFTALGILRRRLIRATAQDYARRLDVRLARLSQRMGTLSGGNQQKVILARGMVSDPRVLILAEPTRGIDVGAKAEIYAILRRLAGEGMAILLISSELPELVLQCSRVLVMAQGRVAAELEGEAISEESVMMAATGASRTVQ
jgi:ABC-type sugar transport system ATPase subunit